MLKVNNLVGFGRRRLISEPSGITLVGTSAGGGTTDLPAGLQEGDYVIAQMAADDNNISSVSGWITIQTRLSSARGVTVAKVMGATPDTDIVVNSNQAVTMMAFRGVDTANPQDVAHTAGNGSGSPNPLAITPITDRCAIVITGALDDDEVAVSTTAPAGFGDLVASNDGNQNATSMMAWLLQETASTINPGAFVTGAADDYWTVTMALRPASGA